MLAASDGEKRYNIFIPKILGICERMEMWRGACLRKWTGEDKGGWESKNPKIVSTFFMDGLHISQNNE